MESIVVNAENEWRTRTPGAQGWARSAQPGSANKYFIISVDSHLGPPPTLFRDRIDKKYLDRLPRIEVKDGKKYFVREGRRPALLVDDTAQGEDLVRSKAGSGLQAMSLGGGSTMPERMAHLDLDGIDGEVIFPNGPALAMFGSADADFAQAQCQIYNDYAWETCKPIIARSKPAACIATANLESAIAEIERCAKMGYTIVTLPSKPVWGPSDASHVNYNQKHFDPMWAAIQEAGLAITFHVSTGSDPRVARGEGGAIINYAAHATAPTMEPVVNLCTSGVLDRFEKLRFATIEANGGWVPWLMDTMDEGYRKHHMWVFPKLKMLPSEYYRRNGMASVCDDRSAMLLAEPYGLENNFMFANDYPHHEGSWPHSAATIERNMGHLKESTRAKILGLNAARFFGFEIPAKYQK